MLRVLRTYLIASMLPLLGGAGLAHGQGVPTATLTVQGAETQSNGLWDSGNMQVDFNGFVEIVNYGQYSTNASLASALAAMFVRDYHSFGLYAKAAVNSAQQNVVTFQLVDGSGFGPLNVVDPSASFSLAGSGFAASSATTADIGVATLTINGTTVATSSYGSGSTAASIAQDLSSQVASNSGSNTPVAVTSEGPNVYLQVKQPTGSYSDSYSLTFSTNVSFSTSTPASGTLTGSTDVAPITVYSYSIANPSGGSGYAANGNVNYLNDSVMGNWAYGYDNLNRLTSGTVSGGAYNGNSACWSYDSFGNRLSQSLSTVACSSNPPPTFSATYSANNQISAVTTTPKSAQVSYDIAGNVTNDGVTGYTYDAEGRVCALNGPQGMIGYQYDGDGNRIGKGTVTNWQSCDITANGYKPMTDFVLDLSGGQTTEMAVYNTSSGTKYTWTHTNVTAAGALIASFDNTGYGLHFYLNDALGSRRAQTDPAGLPEQICQSLPFGDQLYCTGSPALPTEHHFTAKERDTESGLDYFGARYYASNMGRFMSPDWSAKDDPVPYAMLNDPQSLNLYSYVRNNPLSRTDADGHLGTRPNAHGETFEQFMNSGPQLNDYLTNMEQQFADLTAEVAQNAVPPAQQQVSQAGQDFIKGYEKLSLTVYDASGKRKAGDWTIGYGHKTTKDAGPITLPEAEALFQGDVARMASHVSADLNVPVSQNQFDALVSLRFNAGANAITPPVADLNSTGHATMGDFTNHYITAGGVPSRGLELRRAAEWRIFSEGVYDASH